MGRVAGSLDRMAVALRKDVVDDLAVDVGQAEVTAGVAVGQAGVFAAQQVEHCGMQFVDVNFVLDGDKYAQWMRFVPSLQ